MPNEKTSIPCAVCRDLAPLVADGVASAESEALVRAHLEVCPACAAEWPELCAEGERPDQADVPETVPLPDDIRVLRRLHRKLNRRSALLLTAGALGGALLTYSNRFNLIILFFPLVCGVFSWQRDPAWRVLPALTFLCTAGRALVLDACTGVLLVFLFRAAGWQAGRPRPVLNWFDRIPFDALAFCAFWIIAVLINAGDSITYGLNTLELVTELWVGLGFITIGVMGTLLALCLTAAARIRAGTFWHNNVLRMLGSLIGRGCSSLARAWPLTGRTVLLFLLYVVCSVFFLSLPFPVWVALQAVALFALCRWTLQWRRVRDGTERILGGEPEFKIDTSHMYYDLAAHAGQLNDLGEAVGTAVD